MRREKERQEEGQRGEGKYEGKEGKKERVGREVHGWMDGLRGGSAENLYNTQQYSIAQASSLIIA
jgi:hypothetical protein